MSLLRAVVILLIGLCGSYVHAQLAGDRATTPSVVYECISRDSNDKVVMLECEILKNPQSSPARSWFKDGELIYSTTSGFTPDLSEYFMDYPILMPGVLEPISFTALNDGSILYNYKVVNISSPHLLPSGTTIEQAEQQVFDLLLGNWTCIVNNTLGSTATYLIRNCASQPQFSFTTTNIAVNENDGEVQLCVTVDFPLSREIIVSAETQTKSATSARAIGELDYMITAFELTFTPSGDIQWRCVIRVGIIDDSIVESVEQFLVKLIDASPEGTFIEDTSNSCISIIDDDLPEFTISPRNITVFENDSSVEVCISSETRFERNVEIIAQTGNKIGATNQAQANSDYSMTVVVLTFAPSEDISQKYCINITIIDDMISNEPAEDFSVTLISASPDAIFIEDTSCITILDNDFLGNTVATNRNEVIIAVVVAVVVVIIISLVVSFVILAVIIIMKQKNKAAQNHVKSCIDTYNQVTTPERQAETIELKDPSQ